MCHGESSVGVKSVHPIGDAGIGKTDAEGVVRPMGIASADGRRLYVTTGRFGALLEVDPQAGRVVRTVDKIGQRPWGVALSQDGAKAYTANGPSGDVSVIDLQSGRVEARIEVGGSPWGVAAAAATAGTGSAGGPAAAESGIWKAVVPGAILHPCLQLGD